MNTITPISSKDGMACPHCSSNLMCWDADDKEPYCFVCGWRRAKAITAYEANIIRHPRRSYPGKRRNRSG